MTSMACSQYASGADLAQENVDLGLQRFAVARQSAAESTARVAATPVSRAPSLTPKMFSEMAPVSWADSTRRGGRFLASRHTLLLDGGGDRAGDFADQFDDIADFLRRKRQALDLGIGAVGLTGGGAGEL
jgi:hypothetical protein